MHKFDDVGCSPFVDTICYFKWDWSTCYSVVSILASWLNRDLWRAWSRFDWIAIAGSACRASDAVAKSELFAPGGARWVKFRPLSPICPYTCKLWWNQKVLWLWAFIAHLWKQNIGGAVRQWQWKGHWQRQWQRVWRHCCLVLVEKMQEVAEAKCWKWIQSFSCCNPPRLNPAKDRRGRKYMVLQLLQERKLAEYLFFEILFRKVPAKVIQLVEGKNLLKSSFQKW